MSDVKVFWQCPKCRYEYKTSISHRVSGTGCPMCAIRKNAEAKMKSVKMIDPNNGQVLKVFKSITTAKNETGINASNISMVCKGQRKKAGGYIWKYEDV